MAGNILQKFGTTNQAITITLASLATSATVGRASTAVDNTTNLFQEALVTLWVETGTVATNKQILIYAYGTSDGGTSYEDGITGTDASFTRVDPTGLVLVKVIPTPTNSKIYKHTFPIAQAFGGTLPEKWGILVCNDSGAALSGTSGNNKAYYVGVYSQYT